MDTSNSIMLPVGASIVPAPTSHGFNAEQISLIKAQVAKGVSDSELLLFLAVCQRTGLDPFSKQIYAIVRRDKGQPKMVIQTGIDGYRAIADRQGNYAGSDEPLFDERLSEFQMRNRKRKHPQTATCTVYKVVSGVRCPFTATASWESYCPPQGQDSMWWKFPFLMLAKCAEALALRKGWAAQMSGVYTDAEMQQAGGEFVEVEAHSPPMALAEPHHEPEGPDARVYPDRSISEPKTLRMQRAPAEDGEWVDFTVTDLQTKSGEGKRGPWTRYTLFGTVDGQDTKASTFESAILQWIEPLPAVIRAWLVQGQYGLDIKEFGPTGEPLPNYDDFDVGDLGPPLDMDNPLDVEKHGLSPGD